MEALLEHFITQSATYSLAAIALVAFFRVAGAGRADPARHGNDGGAGRADWQRRSQFLAGMVSGHYRLSAGRLDLVLAGLAFQSPVAPLVVYEKNKALLDKTEHALHQHSLFTILVGRFVGPTRPLVPMVAGMLDLPVSKFLPPNILGCLLWPPFTSCPAFWRGRQLIFLRICKAAISNGCCCWRRCCCGWRSGCAGVCGAPGKPGSIV